MAAARIAGLADDGILRIHQVAESTERGSGWRVVEAATRSRVDRKQQAEVTGRQLGIDVEAVYRVAQSVGAEPVSALEQATGIFVSAQSALFRNVEIWRIHKASESAGARFRLGGGRSGDGSAPGPEAVRGSRR